MYELFSTDKVESACESNGTGNIPRKTLSINWEKRDIAYRTSRKQWSYTLCEVGIGSIPEIIMMMTMTTSMMMI